MVILFAYCGYEGLGIEYLSAVLKAAGHETHLLYDPRLFDQREGFPTSKSLARVFDRKQLWRKQLKEIRPDLVAFSVVAADYLWACKTAQMIKEWMDVPIVFGNIYPTAIPETVIKKDFVDYIVVGEGESALLELVESIENRDHQHSIKNVWFKQDGKIIPNPLRPLIHDLDSLPFPDRDLFRRVGRPFNLGIMALGRRGCKNACPYCSNSLRRRIYFGDNYLDNPHYLRRRSVDNFIRELKEARQKYDFKLIRINDDDLAENEPWLEEFGRKYKKEIGVPYKCFVNPESVNENTIRHLKESGCGEVQMGVQSLNPRIRNEILRRHHTNHQISQAIGLLRESGIPFLVDTLLGIPGETEEDFLNIVRFYLQNPGAYINAYWLHYFAGHDIVEIARDQGALTEKNIVDLKTSPFAGTNIVRPDIHPRKMMKYQSLIGLLNYFPPLIVGYVIKLKIYRFFPGFNFLTLFRFVFKFKWYDHDVFPDPRDVYELIGLRRRDEYVYHFVRKLKSFFTGGWLRGAPKS